ncbi:MAG: HlyD family secretion protein [Alphaproteobacteria bacterium]|nr:HlyD family secretion protein [Alphaproteobacteria bacterium]
MTDATPGTDLTPAAATAPEAQPNRGRALMLLAPLALIAAGGAYLWTGRYVETDNAYIRADISNISPEISGTVKEVLVDDNEPVKAGQPLVKLDAINYEILLIGAEASLKNTEAAIDADRIEYRQHLQDRKIAQSELEYAERQYQRQSKLAAASAGAEAARDAAERSLKVARDKVAFADEKIKESLAKLFGDPDIPVEKHPRYVEARAQEAVAKLQIERSTIVAPFDGVVSHVPQIGDFARMGVSMLTLVSTDETWIEANFKETELTHMRPGQTAEVTIDTYPGRTWVGKVDSISQATGSEFALLPPQNASGNWVKVVQRVPVKIVLDDAKQGPPLRAGLSVIATVDTGERRIDAWLKR